MIHSNKHHLSSCLPATHHLRKLLLLPMAGTFLALSSCNDEDTIKQSPPVAITDTEPVGAGLTVIGFAIVGAAVVVVLGRLLR